MFPLRCSLVLLALTYFLKVTHGWQTVFDYRPCYEKRMDERMPLSMDNLIALIEQFERDHVNIAAEEIAEAILSRYRTNGIIYQEDSLVSWSTHQWYEVNKQTLDDKLLKDAIETPIDSFIPREECSLHMSVSHSTDLYPHPGIDASWENFYYPRSKRALETDSRSNTYSNDEIATHPVEFGVIQTSSGPIAPGLLLSGIMTMSNSRTYSVSELIGKDNVDYMPSEMSSKKIDQLYGSTLSGKLGQSAILDSLDSKNKMSFEIGPFGKFGNCTSCARVFSLQNSDYSYFSRAEVSGSVDAMIIAKTLQNRGDTSNIKLSQILRMYYSEHGLYYENIRGCNRKNIFNSMKQNFMEEIETQALNYMYAYGYYYPQIKQEVELKQDDFTELETLFSGYLSEIVTTFSKYMSSSDEKCPISDNSEMKLETETDLVVIYTPIGSKDDIDKQAEYISATARMIEVGYHRSRLAVFNGKTYLWLNPMTNYSNIADYSCNYTTIMNYGTTSSQDFIKVLDELSVYYNTFYNYLRRSDERTGNRNQVVMWNLPQSFKFPSDEYAAQYHWNKFNMSFPDVNFILVGDEPTGISRDIFFSNNNNKNPDNDKVVLVSNSSPDSLEIALEIVEYVKKVPRMFIYPACDTSNSTYDSYNENSHLYTNYVTPNFTTLVRIPPQNFQFSEYVKLSFKRSDTEICVSRKHAIPSSLNPTEETTCEDGTSAPEFEQYYLCDRYVEDCDPIYISITGKNTGSNYCSDEECKFPNQVEFSMTHEGMVCGCWALLPAPLLLLATILLQQWVRI